MFGCNDFYTFPANGLVNGVPGWSVATLRTTSFTDVMGRDSLWPADVRLYSGWLTDGKEYRMAAVPKSDAMLVASGAMETYFNIVARVDHWSDPARRKVSWATPVDFRFPTVGQVHLDAGSDTLVAPMSIAADSRYMYIGYLDKGPDTVLWTYDDFWYHRKLSQRGTVRGEITVWDMLHLDAKGRPTRAGFIVPDTNVGFQAGANDLWYTLNVAVQADGTRLISAEEDGWGKILIHHWCPQDEACWKATPVQRLLGPTIGWRIRGRELQVRAADAIPGMEISIHDLRGRQILRWLAPEGAAQGEWLSIGAIPSSGIYVIGQGSQGSLGTGKSIWVP